jgi:transcriptional regulator with XRE-family HTH domain
VISSSSLGPSHDLTVRIARNLRHLRQSKGWTQSEVAQRMGSPVRANEISRWENAHVRPSEARLFKLAAIFGVEISYLFGDPDSEVNAA